MRKSERIRLLIGASLAGLLAASAALGAEKSQRGSVTTAAAPSSASSASAPLAEASRTPPSQPWAFEKSDVPADPAVRFGTLPNGLRYALMRNTTPPGQASVWLRIDAGSLMEKPNQLGLAHFMEHMAFNGTTDIPKNDLIHNLERLGLQFGADLNAATSFDQTFYRVDMPSADASKLDTALHVLHQQVSAATMYPKDINGERGVIAGEERLRNSPIVKVGLKQLSILGAGTLLPNRNPIGDMSIIRTAPRDRFVDFYQAYYRPSRATVIAVGDFDVDVMEARIKNEFGNWQPAAADGPLPSLGQIEKHVQEAHVYVEPSLAPTLSITWVKSPELAPDTLANRKKDWIRSLALAVLKRRFDQQARSDHPPFATASTDDSDLFRSFHLTSVNATYIPGKWKEALSSLEQSVRQFSQFGITKEELDREVTSYRNRLENAVRAAPTRNSVQLASMIEGSVNDRQVVASAETDLTIFESVVKTLTVADVNGAARTIFTGEGPIVSLNSSEAIGSDADLAVAFDASKRVAVAQIQPPAVKPWAYTNFGTPGRVVSRSEPDVLGAVTVTFENGVKLKVKPTNFAKGEIQVGLLTGIGDANFDPKTSDPRSTAIGTLVSGGLKKMNADEIGRALTGHFVGASLTPLGRRFLLSGNTRPNDLGLEMQYMAAFLTDPAYRSAPFAMKIATAPAGWILANSSPMGVYGIKVKPAIASDDARLSYEPPEVTNKWRMEPLRNDLISMISKGPIEIVMVGEVSVDDAIRAVAPTFGALPTRPDYNASAPGADVRRFTSPTRDPQVFTHNGLKEQALGVVAFPTVDALGNPRLSRQVSVLRSVVQLRAIDIIREKEALAYSPGVSEEYSPDYKDFGTLEIYAATAPEKLPAFYAAVNKIVRDLQSNLISTDELRRARQPMLEHSRQAMNSNGWWWGQILNEYYNPGQVNDSLNVEADLNSVTPEMVRELAHTYLRMDRAYKASVIPSDKAEGS